MPRRRGGLNSAKEISGKQQRSPIGSSGSNSLNGTNGGNSHSPDKPKSTRSTSSGHRLSPLQESKAVQATSPVNPENSVTVMRRDFFFPNGFIADTYRNPGPSQRNTRNIRRQSSLDETRSASLSRLPPPSTTLHNSHYDSSRGQFSSSSFLVNRNYHSQGRGGLSGASASY